MTPRALSPSQIKALRYANGRRLFADDINGGNGNLRRTLLSLFKIGMLDWDPIYGNAVLTTAGKTILDQTPRNPIVGDFLRAKRRADAARSPKKRARWDREADRLLRSMTTAARGEAYRLWLAANAAALAAQGEAP